MAGKKKFDNGTIQYVFKRAGVLDKPIYLTFTDEAEGDAYAKRLDALLDRGIVPPDHRPTTRIVTIEDLVREYEREAHPKGKDRQQLTSVLKMRGDTHLTSINAKWVDDWISTLKREQGLSPATIRAKVGALARCTDWGMRKGYLVMPDHPLRTLPDGYAQYTKTDEAVAGVKRVDVERDRRLEEGEDAAVLAVINGGVLARKQRPLALDDPAALRCMFILAVESAMRMREMYTLTLEQVDLARKTVFLDKTKNGDKRQVPLSSVAIATLKAYLKKRKIPAGRKDDALFPWWSGETDDKTLGTLSDYLSKLYKGIFAQAECEGLTFHDLRHEATSRLFERTKLSETQIMKITGHKSHRMMMRYTNLRGSDLAGALW